MFDDDTRLLPPHPYRRVPPPTPCKAATQRPPYGSRLASLCLAVCCHWLRAFPSIVRSQACNLCHTSFLRPHSVISLTAFHISGFGFSFMLRGCIWRVWGKVFVASIGHFCFATLQGVGGGAADMGGGAVTAYHHHVVWGCFLGR